MTCIYMGNGKPNIAFGLDLHLFKFWSLKKKKKERKKTVKKGHQPCLHFHLYTFVMQGIFLCFYGRGERGSWSERFYMLGRREGERVPKQETLNVGDWTLSTMWKSWQHKIHELHAWDCMTCTYSIKWYVNGFYFLFYFSKTNSSKSQSSFI